MNRILTLAFLATACWLAAIIAGIAIADATVPVVALILGAGG